MIQIQSTANAGSEGIKCLLYGGSGTGKTPALGTAPSPIIISAESGLLSLRSQNLPFIEIKSYANLLEAYQWCLQSTEARQFYTLCLDSISEVMEVLLNEEKRKSRDPRKAYGELLDQGLQIARSFRDMKNKAVIIVAKEEYVKDESIGAMLYQPMLPGSKLGPQLPYFFDETFQMLVGKDAQQKDVRYFRTKRTFQHVARDRSGRLDEFEPANFTHVFTKILS
jgi:hypothetical protein